MLAQLSQLRQELAKATTLEEVQQITDKAEALRILAKRVGERLEIVNQITEDRLWAERRGGEMLRDGERQGKGRPKKMLQAATLSENVAGCNISQKLKLSDIGIERTQAHRWQKLASIPKTEFARISREVREANQEELSRAIMLHWAKERDKQERRRRRMQEVCEISERSIDSLTGVGQFPLIYADPPWEYDFSVDEADEIESHYPTMTIEELCDLEVEEATTEDAILFMWATSPKLEESFIVLNDWGFQYRTCAIWDKEWIGPGYYFRQRHELLLVATRGDIPAPLPENRPDSIFVERRTDHSKKPEIAYQLIEQMYPELPKLELFSRTPREGWHAWGNQAVQEATQ